MSMDPRGNDLARQNSIYSLTLDEFQNSLGGIGKDFGSMNMDEFLKNIWTAEEAQAMASALGMPEGGGTSSGGGNLRRQGSLTLPRTLSQKTVDEVWRDLFRENGGKVGSGNSGLNLQQNLGDITLEEFLMRAGVVGEDTQLTARPDNSGFYGELLHLNNNTGLGLGFSHSGRPNGIGMNEVLENNKQIRQQSPNPMMNANEVRSQQQQQQQQLFPKQTHMTYASSMQLGNNGESENQGMRSSILGISDPKVGNGFVHSGGGRMDMVGLGSPGNQLSSGGLEKSNGTTSTLFNGSQRGRCGEAIEKVVERKKRRMIKNRESAARSRDRKQAYTMELEAEVAKLKEDNEELQKKQAKFLEMQKNQIRNFQNGTGNFGSEITIKARKMIEPGSGNDQSAMWTAETMLEKDTDRAFVEYGFGGTCK